MLLGCGMMASSSAQNSDALNVDLAECVALESEEARFACYQERVDAALAHEDDGVAVESESAAAPSRPATPARRAAEPARAPAAATRANEAAVEQEPEEILGTITALRERTPNTWVITLDNGQVWHMNRPKRYPLRVGQDVRLYQTGWGSSYRLTAPEHGSFVQVERVR
jgi:hypothetical protein